jgi:ribosomal protein L11 methyltransferase
MGWLAVIVEVEGRSAEVFSDALLEAGAASVSIEDADAGGAGERPIFGEPGGQAEPAWPRNRLRVLVRQDVDIAKLMAHAAAAAGEKPASCWRVETVPSEDWVRSSQAQFTPIAVSARLWIVPSWHAPPDPSAINILLDPGLAFGTGGHATTRLCLEWLEERIFPSATVIDYGCGSGILAIAAAKFGASDILGIDIDPDALIAAEANAARNSVSIRLQRADAPLAQQADLVVANILASPLEVLAPLLAACVAPGGLLALAGLLSAQADALQECYAPWFEMSTRAYREGWALLEGRRR